MPMRRMIKEIKNDCSAFTLIEIVVVIAVLALLASMLMPVVGRIMADARVSKAQSDLFSLSQAIQRLEVDTGQLPGHLVPTSCVLGPEIYVDSCSAGIQCTDASFPNWKGPYLTTVKKDPWGTHYYFDPDYTCSPATQGCEGLSRTVRVIESFGPNKAQNYGAPNDDIVFVLCRT